MHADAGEVVSVLRSLLIGIVVGNELKIVLTIKSFSFKEQNLLCFHNIKTQGFPSLLAK
jgi:hypothetical protein